MIGLGTHTDTLFQAETTRRRTGIGTLRNVLVLRGTPY
jgi:hypothetical protein